MRLRRRLVLVATTALPLAACRPGGEQQPSAPAGPKTVILDTDWSEGVRGEVTEKAAAWNERNPNVRLEVRHLGSGGMEKRASLIASDTLGDMALWVSWWVPLWAEQGLFPEDLKPRLGKYGMKIDDIVYMPEHLEFRGKRMGMPFQYNSFDWMYNRDLFREYGVPEPTPNWTWNDFLEAARRLTHPDKDQWGFLVNSAGAHQVWMTFVYANGGEMFSRDGSRCVLDEPRLWRRWNSWSISFTGTKSFPYRKCMRRSG